MKIKIKKDMGESVRFCVPFESLRPLTKSVENKGYALFTARAYQEGHPENTYFIKFSKLEGISKEKLYNMREAFTKENKFKIRYPYIAYVEGCAECILSVDASEAQKQEINKSTPYELLEGETKIICLFEELVNGEDLKTVYSLHADKPISEEWMFRHMHQLIYGMCNYMSYDRDKLVHRDIRPANIRVTSDKMMVKYIDFDWAHISRSKATSLQSRPVGGTPGYMDPRQAKSDTASKKADPTMDIYSLAMVFLYMMLGEHYIDVCGYSDTWDYLEDEEFLYVLKRSNLKRDGKLVYQEDKYSNLLRIIAKMMTVVEKRYQNPEYLLKDFEAFLREYYGMEKYKEFFQEERVLTSQENESIHYIECFRRCEGKKSRMMLQIANYQVLEIRDMLTKQYPIMMLYMLNHQIYYRPMTEEFEVITGDIQKNILTTEKSQFRINTEVLELTVKECTQED